MKKPSDILKEQQRTIDAALIQELAAQGHELTGALAASITAEVNGEAMAGMAYQYIHKLEDGVPANEIQINAATLAEMTRYVELRMGYRGSKAAKVAYLILQKQSEEGNPTSGSYAYSQTGERLGAIATTFEHIDPQISNSIDAGIAEMIETTFNEPKNLTL